MFTLNKCLGKINVVLFFHEDWRMSLLLPSDTQLAQKGQRFAVDIVRFLTTSVVKNQSFFLHKTPGSFMSKKAII